jgi:alkylhydroperoxidase family enzyme
VGSLAALPTDEVLGRVLGSDIGRFADAHAQLVEAHRAAWAATSPRLLELCRVRIATMLGCSAEAAARTPGAGVDDDTLAAIAAWPTDPRFDVTDRACLALTEHYVLDVATVPDELVAAVRDRLGYAGLHDFVHALLVVEQRIRLRLTWDRLWGGGPA